MNFTSVQEKQGIRSGQGASKRRVGGYLARWVGLVLIGGALTNPAWGATLGSVGGVSLSFFPGDGGCVAADKTGFSSSVQGLTGVNNDGGTGNDFVMAYLLDGSGKIISHKSTSMAVGTSGNNGLSLNTDVDPTAGSSDWQVVVEDETDGTADQADGAQYVANNQIGNKSFDANALDNDCPAKTGGAGGGTTTTTQRFSSAGKSAAAGFMNASGSAQNFMTQTQIHNRLVKRMISRNTQSALSGFAGQRSLQDLAVGQALSSSYAAGINRPSRTTWHSKDGLIGKLFGISARKKEPQKRDAEQSDLNNFSGNSLVSGEAYGDLTANASDTGASPMRHFNQPYDIWASAGYTKVDSSESGNNYDGDLLFGRVGVDHLLDNNLLIGGFAGYDKGDADFSSLNTDLDTKASVAGAYFGYLLTPQESGLPVHLIVDGLASYSAVDYDLREKDTGTTADFDADRWSSALSLTAVILKQTDGGKPIRWLPKVGITYSKESQESYRDSTGTNHASQDISLGQLTFGTQVFIPVFQNSLKNAEFFAKVEGQWDFDDVGQIQRSDGTYYRPDDFGATVGVGLRFNIGDSTTLRIEGAAEGIGRDNYDQYTGFIRVDSYF